MDHAGTCNFEPAALFANAAALAFARGAGYVNFEAWFDEGEIAGAEAGADLFAEKGIPESLHGGEEIGEGNVAIDIEAFNLVKEDMGSGGDGLIAEASSRGDHADRRLIGLHCAHLDIAGMGAKKKIGGNIESILHFAGGVIGREVEGSKVIEIGIEIGAILDGETHSNKNIDSFF